jgi:hypothetical protein
MRHVNMVLVMGSEKRLPQQPRETSSNVVLFLGFYIKLILFVVKTKEFRHHRNFKTYNKNLHTRLQDIAI